MRCQHLLDGRCVHGFHGGTPTPDQCRACEEFAPVSVGGRRLRGLGDLVAAATKAVGIKPCGGCQKRREALNRMVPFGGSGNADE